MDPEIEREREKGKWLMIGPPRNTRCGAGACKFLRRKCTPDCEFAPYFPPELKENFATLNNVFGASNVGKLLNKLDPSHRQYAANSLVYEAEMRLHNPVMGIVGRISLLQDSLREVKTDVIDAKKELATYNGPQALFPIIQPQVHPGNPSVLPYNMSPMLGIPNYGVPTRGRQQQQEISRTYKQQQQYSEFVSFNSGFDSTTVGGSHQHQIFEAQQLAAIEQQQQPEFVSFNSGFDSTVVGGSHQHEIFEAQQLAAIEQRQQPKFVSSNSGFDSTAVGGSVTARGFNETNIGGGGVGGVMSPSLALGTFESPYPIQLYQGGKSWPSSPPISSSGAALAPAATGAASPVKKRG